MPDLNVVMTAPRLAPAAVALLETAGCALHYMPSYPSAQAVAELTGRVQADAILTRQGPVGPAALAASPRLRVVARHGVGVDDVDVAEAARRGILVTRAPGSNTVAVAEHTLGMMLALVKQFGPFSATVGAGSWREGGLPPPGDMAGRRLGLVGFGAIGQMVARFAAAFGMRVSAFSPTAPDALFGPVERAPDLASLLREADILSLHLPLRPATRHLIGAAELAALPRGAFVINTARGGLIDEAALYRALEDGQVAGVGLDVFEAEPPPADHPLRGHPRVIATPHCSGATPGALDRMGVMAAECILCVLTGGTVPPDRIVRAG